MSTIERDAVRRCAEAMFAEQLRDRVGRAAAYPSTAVFDGLSPEDRAWYTHEARRVMGADTSPGLFGGGA